MRNKIGLLVGHEEKAQGAYARPPIGMYEFSFNTGLAQAMSTILQDEFDVKIFFKIGATKAQTYKFIESWEPDAVLELHFNSAENPLAYGTETLCAERHKNFAMIIQTAMCKALDREKGNRGVKVLKSATERGYANVHYLKCPNVLIEPFFGSHQDDCALMLKNVEQFCHAIDEALQHYFSLS